MAARVVKEYILPMIRNDGSKLTNRTKSSSY